MSSDQLAEIAEMFCQRIHEGLAEDPSEIQCLPTHIHLPKKSVSGIAYVLDLGGSNLRAGVASLDHETVKFLTPIVSGKIPWKRNTPYPREDFLAMQAELLRSLNCPGACPLGYCFSYPVKPIENGDAVLIHWTKGIHVPDTLGQQVGRMLAEYTRQHYPEVEITSTAVINDTVASLFAALTGSRTDACIGLIVGTGTNLASFFPAAHVPKLEQNNKDQENIPINLESGNFNPPFLTQWDEKVDMDSENPGAQLFEKAVSGMYLGRVFKAVFPDSAFTAASGARGLVEMLSSEQNITKAHQLAAMAIYERSAKLVAAQLAGLMKVISSFFAIGTVSIVAEGSLFWSQIKNQKSYAQQVQQQLEELLDMMRLQAVKVEIIKTDQANLVGAAMAALAVGS